MHADTLDDEVIALCEEHSIPLRSSLAIMALFAGRDDVAISQLLQETAARQERDIFEKEDAIRLCETRGLSLRRSLAVIAVCAGRNHDALHLLDNAPKCETPTATPVIAEPSAAAVAAAAHATVRVKPGADARAQRVVFARPYNTRKPGRPAGCTQKAPSAPGRNIKICPACGEAKGFRAFPKGGDTCLACETGEKPKPFKRATSLAEAENLND